jgi:hypothetical protein
LQDFETIAQEVSALGQRGDLEARLEHVETVNTGLGCTGTRSMTPSAAKKPPVKWRLSTE